MLKTKRGLKRLRAGRDVIFKAFIGALYGALTMCPVILRVGGDDDGQTPRDHSE